MWNERGVRVLSALLLCCVSIVAGGSAALAQPETPPATTDLYPSEPPDEAAEGESFEPSDRRAAAEPGEDREREYFATAISFGAGRDSGLLVDGVEIDDDVYLVRPSIVLDRRPSSRSQFVLAYDPEAQFYDRHRDLDSIEHAGGLLFERTTARRSKFSLGGSLLDGEDPGRKLDSVLLVLPRSPYRQWRAWTGFEHRWQRTTALLSVIHTDTRIDAAPGLFGDGIDHADDTATLAVTHAVARRLDLVFGYSYSHPGSQPDAPAPGDPLMPLSQPLQTLTVGVARHIAPSLSLFLSGGAAETEGDVSALAAFELVRSGRDLDLRLRYDLSLLTLGLTGAGGLAARTSTVGTAFPDSVSHTLGLDLDLRLARRVRWVQSLRGTTAELPDEESVENFTIASRLVFEVLPRLAPFVHGEWLEQSGSAPVGDAFSRYLLTAGFVVGLSGPSETTGVRGRSSSLQRVLPAGRVY